MQKPLNLKSVPSVVKTGVCFVNCTLRTVDIFWIDFNGHLINYVTCKPKHVFNIDTFVGHPWVVFDTNSLDQLLLNKRWIYYPEIVNRPNPYASPFRRSVVYITLPVYSLHELSRHYLANHIHNVEDVATLELPITLQNEVEEHVKMRQLYKGGFKGVSVGELYDLKMLLIDK